MQKQRSNCNEIKEKDNEQYATGMLLSILCRLLVMFKTMNCIGKSPAIIAHLTNQLDDMKRFCCTDTSPNFQSVGSRWAA